MRVRDRSTKSQVPGGDQRFDLISSLFERGPTALLAVDDGQDSEHLAALPFDRRERLQGRPPSGEDVFDYDHPRPRSEAALDSPPGAVVFRLFADREGIQRDSSGMRRRGNCICHRVGTEREPADQLRLPAAGSDVLQTD